MIRIFGRPLSLTAAFFQYLKYHQVSASSPSFAVSGCHRPLISSFTSFSTDSAAANSPPPTQHSELARVATLVDGCDYEHWLVVVEPPKGYPSRSEIVHQHIGTLAMALGRIVFHCIFLLSKVWRMRRNQYTLFLPSIIMHLAAKSQKI